MRNPVSEVFPIRGIQHRRRDCAKNGKPCVTHERRGLLRWVFGR
jgi:hypothetical protein